MKQSSIPDVLVPCDRDAERAVLGGCLLSDDALNYVLANVRAEDFFLESNRWTYQAMRALKERGDGLDSLTLLAELERAGKWKQINDAAHIVALMNAVPTAAYIESHVKQLKLKSTARRLLSASSEIAGFSTDSIQDENEMWLKAMRALTDAAPASTKTFEDANTVVGRIAFQTAERYANPKEAIGLRTGFRDIDSKLRGLRAGLHVWAGRPSAGKTQISLSCSYNMARMGTRVGYVSLEMTNDELATRMIAYASGFHSDVIQSGMVNGKPMGDATYEKIRDSQLVVSRLPIFFSTVGMYSSLEVRSQIQRLYSEQACEVFFVDYLQLLSDAGENRNLALDMACRGFKDLQRQNNVPIVLLSQVSRELERRDVKIPMLSDLRDSGGIEQHADLVIALHREDTYHVNDSNYNPTHEVLGVVRKDRLSGKAEELIELKLEPTGYLKDKVK